MYQRLIEGGNITIFTEAMCLGYTRHFLQINLFESLYMQYEQDPAIRKRSIKAVELFSLFAAERTSTGRIYLQNVDHCNTHSPFNPAVAPVRQSNLCLEIALPTKPLTHIHDEEVKLHCVP